MVRLPVGTFTIPSNLAGAVAGFVRSGTDVELTAIGAGANMSVGKGIAIANIYLKRDGISLLLRPRFENTKNVHGDQRSALIYGVEPVKENTP